MPLNLLKKYPELLDIRFLSESERMTSLLAVYNRDIDNEVGVIFNNKRVYPIKSEGQVDMDRVFKHLTCKDEEFINEDGKVVKRRVFDPWRSERLHWIKPHIYADLDGAVVEVFSTIERDVRKREDVQRTYVYNKAEKYVVVLEPQRNNTAYYLLTAYYLNEAYGEKMLKKKYKKKLSDII